MKVYYKSDGVFAKTDCPYGRKSGWCITKVNSFDCHHHCKFYRSTNYKEKYVVCMADCQSHQTRIVMKREELINKIRNNRSFDLRASEFYEPWDISDETIKDMADDFYYLLKDVLNYLADKEEPASEDLEEVAKYYIPSEFYHMTIESEGEGSGENVYDYIQMIDMFKAGAKWQKEQMMKDSVDACVTGIRIYKEENEVDFTVMYKKGIIPYEIEQEVKVIVIKED